MTDEQWLRAIAKHSSPGRCYQSEDPERGGAHELAGVLEKCAKDEPERFAQLVLRFPRATHPCYLWRVLYALKSSPIAADLKLDAVRCAFREGTEASLRAGLDVLGEVQDARLPEDLIECIRIAARHSNPENAFLGEEWPTSSSMLNHGVNTVRGRAAEAMGDLIKSDERYLSDFSEALEELVSDPSLAVRSVVAAALFSVARYDEPMALRLMDNLLEADDRLLGTAYVFDFIRAGLREHYRHFSPVIGRMLHSSWDEAKKQGGMLACLARLYHQDVDFLAEEALAGEEQCRLGACAVAKSNILRPHSREWCETALLRLFNDDSKTVREEAARCFWHHWHAPETPLTDYEHFIRGFLESPAFADEPTFLLHALEETKRRVPDMTLDVCEAFISRCSDEARDIRTSMAADEHIIGKLVFTAYAQLQTEDLQLRALQVIDLMSLEGLRSAGMHLSEFER